jgi:hypothetical protein
VLTQKPLNFSDGETKIVERQLVLGPAHDGGFYLIGVSGPVPDALFDDVAWSTPHTLKNIIANADQLQLYHFTHRSLEWDDVDTPHDLQRLIQRLRGDLRHAPTHAPKTAHWLRSENLL